MIQLHGIAVSNYSNKVKFVLLEHDIPFEEIQVAMPIADESMLAVSPLGKVPFIRTDEGGMCESQAIVEYLAQRYPEKRIFPADAFAAAKLRELIAFLELHLELVARELYKQAFFGGTVTDATKARVQTRLAKSIPAFARLAKFAPYLAGDAFTVADIAAYSSLPPIGGATKIVLGRDMLFEHGIDWKSYVKRIESERPAAQHVNADRLAYIAEMQARRAAT